jgi:ribulose-phosphate 3-epimerase
MAMIEIIPTNTCPPDLAELSRRSEAFAKFAGNVQLDVADGAFVPATSWPYAEGQLSELRALADNGLPYADTLSYEVHIMAEEPRAIGEHFARAKVKRILGHIEAFADTEEARGALDAWRQAGAQEVGLALLLDTPFPVIEPLLSTCDVVQTMSIARLGYQGAPFDPRVYDRIREIRALHPDLTIEVDGGVSETNIEELTRAGATRFGVGSAISKAADPKAAYETLKKLAEDAVQ